MATRASSITGNGCAPDKCVGHHKKAKKPCPDLFQSFKHVYANYTSDLQSYKADYKAELAELNAEHQTQLAALRKDLKPWVELHATVQAVVTENAALKVQLGKAEKDILALKVQLSAYEATSRSTTEQYNKTIELIERLKSQLDDGVTGQLVATVKVVQADQQTARTVHSQLQSSVDQLSASAQAAEEAVKAAINIATQAQAAAAQAAADIADIKASGTPAGTEANTTAPSADGNTGTRAYGTAGSDRNEQWQRVRGKRNSSGGSVVFAVKGRMFPDSIKSSRQRLQQLNTWFGELQLAFGHRSLPEAWGVRQLAQRENSEKWLVELDCDFRKMVKYGQQLSQLIGTNVFVSPDLSLEEQAARRQLLGRDSIKQLLSQIDSHGKRMWYYKWVDTYKCIFMGPNGSKQTFSCDPTRMRQGNQQRQQQQQQQQQEQQQQQR